MTEALLADVRRALRLPFTPQSFERLAAAEGYLEFVWPRVRSSVETQGFLGSALYMADMALDAVEAVYQTTLTADQLRAAGLDAASRSQLEATLDVFHYTQPQILLVLAALAEAWDRDEVGGQGRVDAREVTPRERTHLGADVRFAPSEAGLLPAITEALALEEPADLYRAVATWPAYLETAWEELQHLVAYPDFRRRGRALYYYARSGARFLAEPLVANPTALRAAGVSDGAIAEAKASLDAALTATATMTMHAEAMRVSLGIRDREVVRA